MVQKRMVTFTLGGMVFEYDEEKNRKMSKSMEYHSGMRHAFSLIMIELSFMMRNTAMMRIVMIR